MTRETNTRRKCLNGRITGRNYTASSCERELFRFLEAREDNETATVYLVATLAMDVQLLEIKRALWKVQRDVAATRFVRRCSQ